MRRFFQTSYPPVFFPLNYFNLIAQEQMVFFLFPYIVSRPSKVWLEEHRKAVCQGEVEKSGMTDHICKEKGNHLPLWDQVEMIDREEH